MSTTTRKLGRLAVVAVSMLLLGELVTRLLLTSPSAQQPDDELGWTYLPDTIVFNGREGGVPLRTNRLGLIDRDPDAVTARHRVLVFGDSLTESLQVPLDANFTSVLERRFADLDVVNLGRSDMSPAHYPVVAERVAAELPADLLVVTVSPGDVVDLLRDDVVVERDAESGRVTDVTLAVRGSDRLKALVEPLITRSALATHMMRRAKPSLEELLGLVSSLRALTGRASAPPPDAGAPLDGTVPAAGWYEAFYAGAEEAAQRERRRGDEVVARLSWVLEAMARPGVPVLLLDLPEIDYRPHGQARDGTPRESEWFRRAAERAGVPYVTAAPYLIQRYAATGQPGHGFANLRIGVGHLNPSGHQAVADAVGAWLRDETTLRARSGAP